MDLLILSYWHMSTYRGPDRHEYTVRVEGLLALMEHPKLDPIQKPSSAAVADSRKPLHPELWKAMAITSNGRRTSQIWCPEPANNPGLR